MESALVNRSKSKGTFAETAVATYLRDNGWPYAERRALAGALDKGDITGTPGLAWEVKYAGSGLKMGEWVTEMLTERTNAGAAHGILVIKPAGRGIKRTGEWFSVMVSWDFDVLHEHANGPSQIYGAPVLTRAPTHYVASQLGDQLFAIGQVAQINEIAVLTLRPRGMREKPENWYRVLTLEHMVRLLRAAGYGS
jgi:hypothetical protein